MKKKMVWFCLTAGFALVGVIAFSVSARAEYESAEYEVLESDGRIEIREYPDLMLASTEAAFDAQGNDGSFSRLFRYISGANEANQKIAMTTPVFMEGQGEASKGKMGFVVPKEVAAAGIPAPKGAQVEIRKRQGGRFAVIRFNGKLSPKLAQNQEAKLREWMATKGIEGVGAAESAGYDAPYIPGFFRRNEVLIRITPTVTTESASPTDGNISAAENVSDGDK
jgi:hypothetical protein